MLPLPVFCASPIHDTARPLASQPGAKARATRWRAPATRNARRARGNCAHGPPNQLSGIRSNALRDTSNAHARMRRAPQPGADGARLFTRLANTQRAPRAPQTAQRHPQHRAVGHQQRCVHARAPHAPTPPSQAPTDVHWAALGAKRGGGEVMDAVGTEMALMPPPRRTSTAQSTPARDLQRRGNGVSSTTARAQHARASHVYGEGFRLGTTNTGPPQGRMAWS